MLSGARTPQEKLKTELSSSLSCLTTHYLDWVRLKPRLVWTPGVMISVVVGLGVPPTSITSPVARVQLTCWYLSSLSLYGSSLHSPVSSWNSPHDLCSSSLSPPQADQLTQH